MTDRGKIVTKIIEGFKTLSNCRFQDKEDLVKVSANAEDLLYTIYKAGVSNIAYTESEKQQIGSLVPSALQGLGYKLSDLQISFSSQSIDSVRIQRSGFQFLVDTFKDSKTLEQILKEFAEQEEIDGLDERLKTVEFDFYSDDCKRNASFEAEIAKLPSTHWWFFN